MNIKTSCLAAAFLFALASASAASAATGEKNANRICRGEFNLAGKDTAETSKPKPGECSVDPIAKTITANFTPPPSLTENSLAATIAVMIFRSMIESKCIDLEEGMVARHMFFEPGWRFIVRMGNEILLRCALPVQP